jgi:integrase
MIPKSLTPAQEHRVADYILKHVRDKDGVSIALLLMFALGLRNQEACGANFGFIHEMLDYPGSYYLTVPQTTAIGTNETKIGGKSYNSGRNIPLPSDLVSILFELRDKRLLMLRKRGLEDVRTIDDIPVAHRKSDPFARCGADEVTRAAKKMFDELGMRNGIHDLGQYLQQDIASASEEADVEEFALIEKEPTGYLLRRNFATHLAILGLADSSQIEYLLGHVVTEAQTERSSYLDERALYAIKLRLDARPLLNPIARAPQIQLKGNTITSINRYSQEVLVPGNASRVYISATAKEPGDSINITVTLPDEAQVYEDIMIRSMPFPLDFPRAADVTKAYHEAYARGKESTSHT